jgi:hypothetical protein
VDTGLDFPRQPLNGVERLWSREASGPYPVLQLTWTEALVEGAPRKNLEQQDAQCVNIRGWPGLFGKRVELFGCAIDDIVRNPGCGLSPEISDDQPPRGCENKISGTQTAVNDSRVVCDLESVSGIAEELRHATREIWVELSARSDRKWAERWPIARAVPQLTEERFKCVAAE